MGKNAGSGLISQRYGSVDPEPYQNATDPQHCGEEKYRYLHYYSLDITATEGVHVYSQNGSMLFYFGDLVVRGQGQDCLINVLYTLRCRKVCYIPVKKKVKCTLVKKGLLVLNMLSFRSATFFQNSGLYF